TTAELAAKGIAATLTKPVRAMHLFHTLLRVLGTVRGAQVASATPASGPAPLRSTGLRVLVVEDNPVNQAAAVRLLARRGHHADVAGNGREALAAITHTRYDVVLMDVQMPEMDGIEATMAIRRGEPKGDIPLPIIAMTAHALESDRER